MKRWTILCVILTTLYFPFLANASTKLIEVSPLQRPLIYSQTSWEPLVFIKDHHISGMIADYLHLLESKTSLRFAYTYDNNWSSVLNRYDAGTLDILPGLIAIDIAPHEIISKPLFKFQLVLAGHKAEHFITNLDQVQQQALVVAVGEDSSAFHYLHKHYPHIKTYFVQTTEEGLMAVEHKKADLFLEMSPIVGYALQNSGLTKIKIVGILKDELSLVMAIKDDTLLPIINQGIDSISQGELDQLYKRYIKVDIQAKTDYSLLFKVLLITFFICVGFTLWLIILKREIKKRKLAEEKVIHTNQRLQKTTEELKMAMAKTAHAYQAKSQFLANMSHEIRTPMNTIIGMTELILRKELPDKERHYLTKVDEASHHLLDIINDILDFSKIEANKIQLEAIPFQLESLIVSVTDLTSIRAQQKGLELLIDLGNAPAYHYKGDPFRLKQVLLNLVSNAIKFTNEGEIIIRLKASKEQDGIQMIRFEVKDTGIGITPEQMNILFSAFSQADMSTTRQYGGTGLGLSIAQGLVMMMKGEIHCESVFNQGSTFWFEIPFRIDTSFSVPSKTLITKALKVLVVDDNETALEIFAEIFDHFGLKCITCKNAQNAITLLNDGFEADVAIIDWKMKGIDGIALFNIIEKQYEHQIASIMMVTAYDKEELIEKLGDKRPYTILVKPVTSSTLFDTLISLYGHQRLSEPLHASFEKSILPSSLAGLRILVVEDNQSNQEVAHDMLEEEGMNVSIVSDGQEAIDWLLKNDVPDIILMDCQMPILDGFKTTQHIRTDLHLDVPIIAMTANAMKGDQEKCYASGMNGYISKPIDSKKLLAEIAHFCHKTAPLSTKATMQVSFALEGIDSIRAIERLGDNVTLYRQLLKTFAKEQIHFIQKYQECVHTKDLEGAKRLCHTLKGIVATLGIDELVTLAQCAELSEHPIDPKSQLLKDIDTKIRSLSAIIQTLSQQDAITTQSSSSIDDQALLALIEKLRSADATALDDAVMLEGAQDSRLLEAYEQIKSFEFDNAISLIEPMIKTFHPNDVYKVE